MDDLKLRDYVEFSGRGQVYKIEDVCGKIMLGVTMKHEKLPGVYFILISANEVKKVIK